MRATHNLDDEMPRARVDGWAERSLVVGGRVTRWLERVLDVATGHVETYPRRFAEEDDMEKVVATVDALFRLPPKRGSFMTTIQEKSEFKSRVREWAEKLDVPVRSMTLRPMRNKWASCSTAGNLTFDVALLGLEAELREYVIVHELLHLSVPNHGRLWKSLMHAHLGDYESLHQRLRESATFLAQPVGARPFSGELVLPGANR